MPHGLDSKIVGEGLTFDDVLLIPAQSEVLPAEVNVMVWLILDKIFMGIPLISAAMDTVTEARLAIALAREGGAGVIHRNMSAEKQAAEVKKVKRSESVVIVDPVTIRPEQRVQEALALMERHRISGIPVVDGKQLVGIITNRDLRFERDHQKAVTELMTTRERLITAPKDMTLDNAKELMHRHRIEKLPLVDESHRLTGLITIKDIEKRRVHPHACKDARGRLVVGAAVDAARNAERSAVEKIDSLVRLLVEAEVDFLVVDTAHGHSREVLDTVERLKHAYWDIPIVAGNVATAEATLDLISAGANVVKVGVGPASIGTTRVIAGIGVPQLSAIADCAEAAASRGDFSIIADGGIRYSGDIVKALAAGARAVMIGSIFAGTDESPGESVLRHGRAYKTYRGMSSLATMQGGGADRYFQNSENENGGTKLVPEGVEGLMPAKGSLAKVVHQLVGGLRAGMGYCGAPTIEELRKRARFIKISPAALHESHVHDIVVTQEAPNYQMPEWQRNEGEQWI